MVLINITPVSPSASIKPQISSMTPNEKIVWEVKQNETLGGIASAYYGKDDYWIIIAKDNPWIKNPNSIDEGWMLSLRKMPLDKKTTEKIEREFSDDESNASESFSEQVTSTTEPVTTTPTPPSNFDEVYKEAGAKYGVPWQVLYGIHLTETGLRDGAIFNGQGSGARGPMQFMPSTFAAYATDGDGDGIPNIDNAKDAIHTAANYMAKHGSLDNGLRSYGGNTPGVLAAARARGFTQ
ncbi:lytic transglycosylase domain-containing protein [Patescibacteria group bacterium]|nr:lytic transglycosylase domain-containing protein [Patescibacteria group bacterium]